MHKGSGLPLVLLSIFIFVITPVVYFYLLSPYNNSAVKGITAKNEPLRQGISLSIFSPNGTWSLYEYLCESKDDCSNDLLTGREWGIVNGASTSVHEVRLSPSSIWNKYEYIKLFVRPGSGSIQNVFSPSVLVGDNLTEVTELIHNGERVPVVFISLETFFNQNSPVFVTFKDTDL